MQKIFFTGKCCLTTSEKLLPIWLSWNCSFKKPCCLHQRKDMLVSIQDVVLCKKKTICDGPNENDFWVCDSESFRIGQLWIILTTTMQLWPFFFLSIIAQCNILHLMMPLCVVLVLCKFLMRKTIAIKMIMNLMIQMMFILEGAILILIQNKILSLMVHYQFGRWMMIWRWWCGGNLKSKGLMMHLSIISSGLFVSKWSRLENWQQKSTKTKKRWETKKRQMCSAGIGGQRTDAKSDCTTYKNVEICQHRSKLQRNKGWISSEMITYNVLFFGWSLFFPFFPLVIFTSLFQQCITCLS